MEYEIDLHGIFNVLWKSRKLIIGIFIIAVLVAGVVSFVIPPIYSAGCTVALGNFSDPIYTNELVAKKVLLSDDSLLSVIKQLNLDVPPYKFKAFKDNIQVKQVNDKVLEITIETQDQQNATNIVENIASLFINRSEMNYNKYRSHLYDKLAATQKNLAEVDQIVNQTDETLRKVDELPGTTQEQIELSHSRTLQYLQNEESRRASLMNQVLESKMQFDSLENTKILMRSGEPIYPVWPPKALIVAVVGMLGLMIGIFAAFLREGLGRKVEYSAEPNE